MVYKITNLNDSGRGSLREAVEKKGARVIVFSVSGNIVLRSPLEIKNDSITIAGQTAPGGGICLQNYPFTISANHVIIRYLRFRLGDLSRYQDDAINGIKGNNNIIIDHCSASWGIDEVMSFWNVENITVQWCIISESLNENIHEKGNHGYGGIWGGTNASYHHNLIAHHSSRTPRFAGGVLTPCTNLNFYNNVIYNWGFNNIYGGEDGTVNVINNYFKPGPATRKKVTDQLAEPWAGSGKWFIKGNYTEASIEVSTDNWMGVRSHGSTTDFKSDHSLGNIPDVIESPSASFDKVLKYSGAILPERDIVDKRIIQEVKSGSATFCGRGYSKEHDIPYKIITGIIDSQKDVGGWPRLISSLPQVDSDEDGIPDEWEIRNNLNPSDPVDNNTVSANGYTFIEEYVNGIGLPGSSSIQIQTEK